MSRSRVCFIEGNETLVCEFGGPETGEYNRWLLIRPSKVVPHAGAYIETRRLTSYDIHGLSAVTRKALLYQQKKLL